MLANYGVTLKGKMFDTMIAHYVLQPELRHGMDPKNSLTTWTAILKYVST